MSKVELSDAELIATLKATAWHLSKRLTAHNVELDELRKIVERQEALVKAAKEAGRPYLMIARPRPSAEGSAGRAVPAHVDQRLINAEDASMALCHQCKTGIAPNAARAFSNCLRSCGHAQALHSDYDEAAAVLLCRKSGGL